MAGTDWATVWGAVAAFGSVVSAGVAAWAARQSRRSSEEANAATQKLADIERDRRRTELTPQFRVNCPPSNPGSDSFDLRAMLVGPTGLERIDQLTVIVRDDHFRRGDWQPRPAGPTQEQIREQIWGPFHFTPNTGPDQARADATGRTTVYDHELPVGEELPFQLEPTWPPPWSQMNSDDWKRQRGQTVRLSRRHTPRLREVDHPL